MTKDGVVKGPFVHLQIESAERVLYMIAVSGDMNCYWEYVSLKTPLPELDSKACSTIGAELQVLG